LRVQAYLSDTLAFDFTVFKALFHSAVFLPKVSQQIGSIFADQPEDKVSTYYTRNIKPKTMSAKFLLD
jgi:hypothetical protein